MQIAAHVLVELNMVAGHHLNQFTKTPQIDD